MKNSNYESPIAEVIFFDIDEVRMDYPQISIVGPTYGDTQGLNSDDPDVMMG